MQQKSKYIPETKRKDYKNVDECYRDNTTKGDVWEHRDNTRFRACLHALENMKAVNYERSSTKVFCLPIGIQVTWDDIYVCEHRLDMVDEEINERKNKEKGL